MADNTINSIQGLVGDAIRESTDLARKEFALFRTEMSSNVSRIFTGIAALVLAAVFAIGAIVLLTQALVEWLAVVLDSEALAALIVGGLLLALAVACVLYGRSAMSSASLTPTRTARSLQRDKQVLAERTL